VRVRRRPAGLKPAPGRRLLLRDADHHDAEATIPFGLVHVAAGDQLLGLALLEMHHRDPVLAREALNGTHVRRADLAQRRPDRESETHDPTKPHQHPFGLQLGQVASEEDAVHAIDLQRHPLAQ
jgi:hypothetical protein